MNNNQMSKLKQIMMIMLSCILMFTLICITSTADGSKLPEEGSDINAISLLDDVGEVVDGGEVYVDGEINKLYCVFADRNEAIADIKTKVPGLLSILKDEYNLATLEDENWEQYKNAMFMLFESKNKPDDYNESNIEFCTLAAFFDIYENSDKNEQIKETVNLLVPLKTMTYDSNKIKEELALLLPYTEPLVQDFMKENESDIVPFAGATYDISKAVQYANKYAITANMPTYYYFTGGDCANFVSQILENSGVSQIYYNDVNKGWWHKRELVLGGLKYKHTHSRSWTVADTFARYQGVVYTTKSHASFKQNISKGSLIISDRESDGDWDHCGFVSDKTSSDYKVAQHSSNYNEWASSSKNNWDNVGSNGGKYGRVRK